MALQRRSRPLLTLCGLVALTIILGFAAVPELLWGKVRGLIRVDEMAGGLSAVGSAEADANRLLLEQVTALEAENVELRRRLTEYDELAERSGLVPPGMQLLRSRILGRSAEDGDHYLELENGAVDGVQVGDPVLAGASLVGVVRGESAGRSLVQLCSDRGSRIPATVLRRREKTAAGQDRWVADGSLAGVGDPHRFSLRFVEDRPGLEIEPGMLVVTSGLTERIPAGLVLGEVVSATPAPHSDLWEIQVEPLRPWGSYPTVQVLADGQEGPP